MTPIQKKTVDALKKDNFELIEYGAGVARLVRGADSRLVQADGTQKRGQHKLVSADKFTQVGRFKGERPVKTR